MLTNKTYEYYNFLVELYNTLIAHYIEFYTMNNQFAIKFYKMENITEHNTVDVLNSLIIINNDRIEGYKIACKETKETDLKTLFSNFIQTSEQCRIELAAKVAKLVGSSNESTRIIGDFFIDLMDVKVALTANNRKAILDSCKYGERVVLETYKNVLIQDVNDINSKEQNMLNMHYELLKSDYNKIEELRIAISNKNE
ncbi:DUF2383 domain-containing protein [Flavobacterium terrigena]|uniref:DUF2383 domain-containing protein n=2 Tax=Flavobacterium terrigena TaxID=402734 RepID=A0A1H6QI28_9FLAO|nr:conserved hypothetical protein [Flavobacterium terrigena]